MNHRFLLRFSLHSLRRVELPCSTFCFPRLPLRYTPGPQQETFIYFLPFIHGRVLKILGIGTTYVVYQDFTIQLILRGQKRFGLIISHIIKVSHTQTD